MLLVLTCGVSIHHCFSADAAVLVNRVSPIAKTAETKVIPSSRFSGTGLDSAEIVTVSFERRNVGLRLPEGTVLISSFHESFVEPRSWYCCYQNFEPPYDKINKMTVRPAKTQISLGIRLV